MTITTDIKHEARARVDELLPELFELSQDLHAHPELALQEHHAVEAISQVLNRHGVEVKTGVAGIETAFVAEGPHRPGRRVGFLAEYDALPGLGHACGHNLIGPASLGAFLALVALGDHVEGSVTLFGTPAEEDKGGKIPMVEHRLFDGLDAAIMTHPMHEPGSLVDFRYLAAGSLTLRFHGRASHTAAAPTEGINALDALVMTYVGVNGLRQRLPGDVNISAIITNGGQARNIIPDFAELAYLVRAWKWQRVDDAINQIVRVARGCAASMGATVEIVEGESDLAGFKYYTEDRPNQALMEVVRRNLDELGIPHFPFPEGAGSASSDFANVSQVVPGIQPSLGLAGAEKGPHTIEFARATGTEAGRDWIRQAASLMAMSALDVINTPGVAAKVRESFDTYV